MPKCRFSTFVIRVPSSALSPQTSTTPAYCLRTGCQDRPLCGYTPGGGPDDLRHHVEIAGAQLAKQPTGEPPVGPDEMAGIAAEDSFEVILMLRFCVAELSRRCDLGHHLHRRNGEKDPACPGSSRRPGLRVPRSLDILHLVQVGPMPPRLRSCVTRCCSGESLATASGLLLHFTITFSSWRLSTG